MKRNKYSAQTIALTGMLAAVALVLLLAASVTPSGWIGVTAVAGLAVAVAVATAGMGSGLLCYVTASLLGLLFLPAKRVALVFLALFGLYPLLKQWLERCRIRAVEYLLKLVFCNAVLLCLYFFAYQLLFAQALTDWAAPVSFLPVLLIGGSVVFLLYDYAFTKVMSLLQARLIPQMKRRFSGR
jgi:hypothetical protein